MKIEWNKNKKLSFLIGFEYEKFIGCRELTIWFFIGNIVLFWNVND